MWQKNLTYSYVSNNCLIFNDSVSVGYFPKNSTLFLNFISIKSLIRYAGPLLETLEYFKYHDFWTQKLWCVLVTSYNKIHILSILCFELFKFLLIYKSILCLNIQIPVKNSTNSIDCVGNILKAIYSPNVFQNMRSK